MTPDTDTPRHPVTQAEEDGAFRALLEHINTLRAARNQPPIMPFDHTRISRWILLCASAADLESARQALGWPVHHSQDARGR